MEDALRPRVGMVREETQKVPSALLAEETSATRRILQIDQTYRGDILTGFAWAKRSDVDRFKRRFERIGEKITWRFWRGIYWRCPIKDSRPLKELTPHLM